MTITSTASFPFNTAGGRQLQQFDVSNAFNAVMKNTVNQLLIVIGKLITGQTIVDVKITWAEVVNNILQVTFEIILEELCTINCANQAAETNLDNDVKDAMDQAFVSGVFVTTFKAKADTTIAEATSADPNYVADSLLVVVKDVTGATGTSTVSVAVTPAPVTLSGCTNLLFPTNEVFKKAVKEYISQECSTFSGCAIGQT